MHHAADHRRCCLWQARVQPPEVNDGGEPPCAGDKSATPVRTGSVDSAFTETCAGDAAAPHSAGKAGTASLQDVLAAARKEDGELVLQPASACNKVRRLQT